jgi:hypothetical protein
MARLSLHQHRQERQADEEEEDRIEGTFESPFVCPGNTA